MTDSELAKQRMEDLIPAACPPHTPGCGMDDHPAPGCPACSDAAQEALSELRRLGALYRRERDEVADRIGPTLAARVWPVPPRGADWRAA